MASGEKGVLPVTGQGGDQSVRGTSKVWRPAVGGSVSFRFVRIQRACRDTERGAGQLVVRVVEAVSA